MNKQRGVYTLKTGDRLFYWTVVADRPIYDQNKHKRWPVECVCGDLRLIYEFHLRSGKPKSCGCRGKYHYHRSTDTPEYNTWRAMKQRCLNPKHKAYHRYGGRGIMIYEPWIRSFEVFLADVGQRPLGKTLDRKNNNGNYEPGNVRWATAQEQAQNTRQQNASMHT